MRRVLEYLEVLAGDAGGDVYRCRRCGHVLGPADGSFKAHAASYETPVSEGQPARAARHQKDGWVLRHFICPSCAVLLEVDMLPAGEPSADSAILAGGELGG